MKTLRSILTKAIVTLTICYGILLIPFPQHADPVPASKRPFLWNQDARWDTLESRFAAVRKKGCEQFSQPVSDSLDEAWRLLTALSTKNRLPDDPLFDSIEETIFALGPEIAACPSFLPRYLKLVISLREVAKTISASWDMNSGEARNKIYRLLYGTRQAVEEVMLQENPDSLPAAILCTDEPSRTPAATILGMQIHSGDILVSRGGAPTSALIARGNDYPGNFSHVALVDVDSLSGKVSVVESHIERGVAVATIDEYLRDTKLRVMVLRLRANVPAMQRDPMVPHKAAEWVLHTALSRHIPYDFAMDFSDSSRWFCSEVASTAYRTFGLKLWMGLSTISSAGVASWLAAFGVKHFETQEPSDLEYDPQLRVVAEWRDRDALFKDHVDNAVIDVLLEGAERGERLDYTWSTLPLARMAKAYSWLLNQFGAVGPVPEGMSGTTAAIFKRFVARHAVMKEHVLKRIAEFRLREGYVPPYWELVKLARAAAVRP